MLCASMQETYSPCQISTMDAPFCAQLHYRCVKCNQEKLHFNCSRTPILLCTFIHETPSHNCVTILGHSKYDILEYRAGIPKTVHACFNFPLPHLHRLSAILMDFHHFTLQPSMNSWLFGYKSYEPDFASNINIGMFLH